jgi:hypothetical protein
MPLAEPIASQLDMGHELQPEVATRTADYLVFNRDCDKDIYPSIIENVSLNASDWQ